MKTTSDKPTEIPPDRCMRGAGQGRTGKHRRWAVLIACLLPLTGLFSAPVSAGADNARHGTTAAGPVVTAVIPPDAPPTYFRDPRSGLASGFAVDILDALAERAGIRVTYRYGSGWEDIIAQVETGKADLAPGMGVTDDRRTHVSFTDNIEIVPISFFVRSSFDLLGWTPEGQTVGVIEHSVALEHLQTIAGIHLVEYRGFVEGLFDLLSGRVNAFACPAPTLLRLAQESGVEDRIKIVGKPIAENRRSIALRKTDRVLRDRLNRALEGFVSGPEYARIYAKWYGKPKPFWTIRKVVMTSLAIGSFVLLIAGMTLWRYRTVVRLNGELQKALATIKTLEGILPVCSHCKKIRDDRGAWRPMESYISERTPAEFSHGICDECLVKYYPQYAKKKPR